MQSSKFTTAQLMVFNKPFNVLCQFTAVENRQCLADYIDRPDYYPAGRLDKDSEGLMLLTNNGKLQHRISHPDHKLEKRYLVQLEGEITEQALLSLQTHVQLKDGPARASFAKSLDEPDWLWSRNPPVRYRANIPTSWIELGLTEGRNRQVRRMTAAVGFPTLRLVRVAIGGITVHQVAQGQYALISAEKLGLRARVQRIGGRSQKD